MTPTKPTKPDYIEIIDTYYWGRMSIEDKVEALVDKQEEILRKVNRLIKERYDQT
ncbi:MAG: hypothetical protein ABIJ18_01450 [archaeon]